MSSKIKLILTRVRNNRLVLGQQSASPHLLCWHAPQSSFWGQVLKQTLTHLEFKIQTSICRTGVISKQLKVFFSFLKIIIWIPDIVNIVQNLSNVNNTRHKVPEALGVRLSSVTQLNICLNLSPGKAIELENVQVFSVWPRMFEIQNYIRHYGCVAWKCFIHIL